jgi:protein LSM12
MELTVGSNLPVRWHNKEIVVHDSVIIKPPYNVEDCKGPANKQDVLIRVKKVLEGERKKLKEKEDRDRKVAIAVEPRKGG